MPEFQIVRQKNRPSNIKKSAKLLICGLLGVVSLVGCRCARRIRLAGDVMPIREQTLTREACIDIVYKRLTEVYGAVFMKDYPLTLTDTVNGTNFTIRFTADGCDPVRKLAYEMLEEDYTDISNDPAKLTYDELLHIVDYRFGGYRIFLSTPEGTNGLNGNMDYFISLDE